MGGYTLDEANPVICVIGRKGGSIQHGKKGIMEDGKMEAEGKAAAIWMPLVLP